MDKWPIVLLTCKAVADTRNDRNGYAPKTEAFKISVLDRPCLARHEFLVERIEQLLGKLDLGGLLMLEADMTDAFEVPNPLRAFSLNVALLTAHTPSQCGSVLFPVKNLFYNR